jgi:ubiquinone/menaquinone biosynthesis C-methylase UbiE
MSSSKHGQFIGSIPEAYDTHLVPLLFDAPARDLAGRAASRVDTGGKVLEIACGTGISTKHLREALPRRTSIVATDLNESMLEYARTKCGELPGVTFQMADAMALPFGDEEFDAVVCQFGVTFFPDKAKGLAEMARVLKRGGSLVFNVWDSLEKNRVAAISHETITSFFEADPPTFLTTPFGFYDTQLIETLLAQEGFAGTESEVVTMTIGGREAASVARGFVAGNPGLLEIQQRASAEAEVVVEAVADALEENFGPTPLRIPIQEIVFTTSRPR